MEEIFKQILAVGFEEMYEVSNYGNVRSLPRRGTIGGILTPQKNKKGYLNVRLYKNGKWKTFPIHRLVAAAFLPPSDLSQVNHKDEDKTNNFVWVNDDGTVDETKSNLEYCTNKYNHNYGTRNERAGNANRNGKCSKAVLQFDLKGNFIKEYPSMNEVERQLGYRQGAVSACCRGVRNMHKGYMWKYKKEVQE